MPASTAGPISRHRLALGRIPGLEINDNVILPGDPGRQFLASDQYSSDGALGARQVVNGIYLVQTIDWFLEFAPTDEQNEHHNEQFWTLIQDETGIKIDRLTPSNVEKIYVAFQEMRRLFKARIRHDSLAKKAGTPDERIFFIRLLDDTHARFVNGTSRFQLHYGLRKDENFGERMATRVLQWRSRLENPKSLLRDFPQMAHDFLPVKDQDINFKQMAETYALTFNKASSKTVVDVAADDNAKIHVSISKDSPKTAKLKTIDLRLTNAKVDLGMQMMKVADGTEKSLNKSIEDLQKEVTKLGTVAGENQNDVKQSLSTITKEMVELKKMVSFLLRHTGK